MRRDSFRLELCPFTHSLINALRLLCTYRAQRAVMPTFFPLARLFKAFKKFDTLIMLNL